MRYEFLHNAIRLKIFCYDYDYRSFKNTYVYVLQDKSGNTIATIPADDVYEINVIDNDGRF